MLNPAASHYRSLQGLVPWSDRRHRAVVRRSRSLQGTGRSKAYDIYLWTVYQLTAYSAQTRICLVLDALIAHVCIHLIICDLLTSTRKGTFSVK